jgi:hypothetical protein
MKTPGIHDLTKHDFADKNWVLKIGSNLGNHIGTIVASVVATGLILGFAHGVRAPEELCTYCIDKMDQMPKIGHLVKPGETLYGICTSLGVPEQCLSDCSRYLAELNGMNPGNPELMADEYIGMPESFK